MTKMLTMKTIFVLTSVMISLSDRLKKGASNIQVLSQSVFITDSNHVGIKVTTQSQLGEKQQRHISYFFDGKNGTKFEFVCSGGTL